MIALDTNVLARAILRDDQGQSPIATQLIKKLASGEGIYIGSSTLLELVWVLSRRKNTAEIYDILRHFLESEGVTFANTQLVSSALEFFRSGKIDFGDCMMLAEAQIGNISKVVTFDEDFIKFHPHVVTVNSLLKGK